MEFFFNLVPFIPLLPLLAFAAVVLFTHRNNRLSSNLVIGAIALSTLISWLVVLATIVGAEHVQATGWSLSIPWLPTASTTLSIGFTVDGLTAAMLFKIGRAA